MIFYDKMIKRNLGRNKWLKDRKKRLLSLDDIKHYCKIVTSLQKTIEAQKAIDDIYPEVEKETVEIENR